MKRLKAKLRDWSKEAFGNIFHKVEEYQRELLDLQQQIPTSEFTIELSQREIELIDAINGMLRKQNILMMQKSRAHWLTDGD